VSSNPTLWSSATLPVFDRLTPAAPPTSWSRYSFLHLQEAPPRSTSKKDQNDKFGLYERAGVREYWVIDPAAPSPCPRACSPRLAGVE